MTILCLLLVASGLDAREPYGYLEGFCAIGERVPGTSGHIKARNYITSHLENPEIDSFFTRNTWFFNIYQRFPGPGQRIAIAAHWDSDIGCPGANDGGSGVSLLLSLADTLTKDPAPSGVDLLFFDGEDVDKAELLGSKHFAAHCVDDYSFVLVIDMVGDRELQIFKEGNSVKFFPDLVDSIWNIALDVAPRTFIPVVKYHIVDDHISLIQYGLRAINIIDFDYPYWDTGEDTIDKCSRESLDIMYSFLLRIVYPPAP
jgi:hypothetical protein